MRLSIWRQFSSNHSGSFTLVGEFASVEQAEQAAIILRQLFIDIQQWHLTNVESLPLEERYGIITPPEQAFRERYGDLDERCIDWAGLTAHEQPANAVQRLGNRVLLITLTESWDDPTDYQGLLDHLGSQQTERQWEIDGTYITKILLNLHCTAPSEAEAIAFVEAFEQHLANPEEDTPWQATGDRLYQGRPDYWGAGQLEIEGGQLHYQGVQVQLIDVDFAHFAYAFPTLLAYLQEAGYLDISYTLTETSISE